MICWISILRVVISRACESSRSLLRRCRLRTPSLTAATSSSYGKLSINKKKKKKKGCTLVPFFRNCWRGGKVVSPRGRWRGWCVRWWPKHLKRKNIPLPRSRCLCGTRRSNRHAASRAFRIQRGDDLILFFSNRIKISFVSHHFHLREFFSSSSFFLGKPIAKCLPNQEDKVIKV